MQPKRIVEAVLWIASAAALFLAFAWPVAVSSDPASPLYRALAIAAFCAILGAIAWRVAARMLHYRR